MAYLTIGPEFYKYRTDLYKDIISFLDNPKLIGMMGDVKKIGFDSEKFNEDEFCVALIKHNRKNRELYLFDIIQAEKFNRHLNK